MEREFHLDNLADTLLLIPHLLGYYPQQKIVVLALRKILDTEFALAGQKFYQARALSLFPSDDSLSAAQLATRSTQMLIDFSADIAVIAWYGKSSVAMQKNFSLKRRLRQVRAELEQKRQQNNTFLKIGIWGFFTDYRKWGYLFDSSADAVPQKLANFPDLRAGNLGMELIYGGSAPLSHFPLSPAGQNAGNNSQIKKVDVATLQCPPVVAEKLWEEMLPQFFETKNGNSKYKENSKCRENKNSNFSDIAQHLIIGLRNIEVRDKVILYAVYAPLSSIRGISKEQITDFLDAACREVPDKKKILQVIRFLERLQIYCSLPEVSVFSVIAYLYWWLGKGDYAHFYLQQAQQIDEKYQLAQLLEKALHLQLFPPWLENTVNWE
ncbi:hypothetical protein [uncultured Arcanobacterium sp.]|uniref:hypothetical protein n=1 Tax=uncultured Arcanobacterium sp. TaxID=487520 RepID=UPI00262591CC|nr:hypothetical protein [uncultured Arcanobacterium sp.]